MLYAIIILSVLFVVSFTMLQRKFFRLQKKYLNIREELDYQYEETNKRISNLDYITKKKKMAYYAKSFSVPLDAKKPLFFEENGVGECVAIFDTKDCYPPLEGWEKIEEPWLEQEGMVRATLDDEMYERLQAKLENMQKNEGED